MTITVIIPHLPERQRMLGRALDSIDAQTHPPETVIVEVDYLRTGEAATRNRALAKVTTPWVAFLDDDDEMGPDHLRLLSEAAEATGADLAWSWYDTVGGGSYRASFIEIATLVKTSAIRSVGGFPTPMTDTWPYRYPDWGMLANLLNAGYTFCRVDAVTWTKHFHDSNICGTGFGA